MEWENISEDRFSKPWVGGCMVRQMTCYFNFVWKKIDKKKTKKKK
jgi:hypothetical protein